MHHATHRRSTRVVVSSLLLLAASVASAQDGFGGATGQPRNAPRPQEYPQQQRPPQPPPHVPQAQGSGNEMQDFGVTPTQQLRPTQQLHGPTPTSIPGGRVIGTQQLAQLLQGGQAKPLVLHLYGGPQGIPGAVPAGPAAQGGGFDDQVQQGFGQFLRQATGGDTSRLIVLYCGGVQCWGSYNAALRAMKLGYRNVAWYRGGVEAWQQAGLPMQPAGGQMGSTQ